MKESNKKNVLIITQKVDASDDVLGVYHEWIKEIAKHVQQVSVICLYRGTHQLPENTRVYSLGKERGRSRIKYLFNFYKYVWQLRKKYDVVFVHMNPEYVVLAGPLWRAMGKRIVLWYAHYLPNWKLHIAQLFSHRIVTSVRKAYPLKSKKLTVVGQGIDVERFSEEKRVPAVGNRVRLLFLGRISPVKDLETLVDAARILRDKKFDFHLDVVGAPTERDTRYLEKVKGLVREKNISGHVSFLGNVANTKTPSVYAQHDIFINLTQTGSFDKSTLEAMASRMLVIVTNEVFKDIFLPAWIPFMMFKEKDAADLAEKIVELNGKAEAEKETIRNQLRDIIFRDHSLGQLAEKLTRIFEAT